MLVAKCAQAGQVAGRGHAYAGLALDGLDQHGGDVAGSAGNGRDGVEVAERRPNETPDERFESRLRFAAARGRERGHRAAVEAVFHDDDTGARLAPGVAVQPGDLQCALDGLGAGIAEEHPLHAREAGDPAGEFLLPGNAHQVAGVDQGGRLVGDHRRQCWVRVAQRADAEPADRVQVTVSVLVPEPGPFAALERDRQGGVGVHQVVVHGMVPPRQNPVRIFHRLTMEQNSAAVFSAS